MVGVAGKSKGCNTCRQRKIACGLQRPKCAQCIRSSRECLGYDRETVFVPVHASSQQKKTVWMMKSSFKDAKKTKKSPSDIESLSPSISTTVVSPENYEETNDTVRSDGNPELSFGTQFFVNSYRQQLLGAFITVCFPTHKIKRPARRTPWPALLSSMVMRTGGPLEQSTLAVSAAAMGRFHNDSVLLNESLKFYTQGLKALRHSLKHPRLVADNETLAACLALSLYEVMEAPAGSRRGYHHHTNGCLQLIKLRGTEAHQFSVGHQLFVALRSQGLLLALETQKPNFLSEPLWMTEPWRHQPKLPIDELMDCLAEAPAIFNRSNSLYKLRSMTLLVEAMDIYEHCWRLDAKLQEIYRQLENDSDGPLYWSVLSNDNSATDDPILGKVFPVAFEFNELGSAQNLLHYWALTVMAWSGMTDLYKLISTIQVGRDDAYCSNYPDCTGNGSCRCHALVADSEGTLRLDLAYLHALEHRADYLTPARNVCQSVKFCLQNPTLGSFMISAPLSIVYETLREKEKDTFAREIAWMKETLYIVENSLRIHKYPT